MTVWPAPSTIPVTTALSAVLIPTDLDRSFIAGGLLRGLRPARPPGVSCARRCASALSKPPRTRSSLCSPAQTRPARPEARTRCRVDLGRLVLGQPLRALPARLARLPSRRASAPTARGDRQRLVRPDAGADLGEPRGVDADDVRRQDPGPSAVVELDHGVARVDPARGRRRRRSGPARRGRRRRRGIRPWAARAGPAAAGCRRPARRGPGSGAPSAWRERARAAGPGPDRRRTAPKPDVLGRRPAGRRSGRSPSPAPAPRRPCSGSSAGFRRHDRDLVLGQRDRQRLLGVFQVDDLRDQPAAVDGVVEVVLGEDDPDRELRRVDPGGPVEVADDLDDREELGPGPVGQVREPEPVADARPSGRPSAGPGRRPSGTGSGAGPSTSTFTPAGPWNRTTWTFGGRTGPADLAARAADDRRPRRRRGRRRRRDGRVRARARPAGACAAAEPRPAAIARPSGQGEARGPAGGAADRSLSAHMRSFLPNVGSIRTAASSARGTAVGSLCGRIPIGLNRIGRERSRSLEHGIASSKKPRRIAVQSRIRRGDGRVESGRGRGRAGAGRGRRLGQRAGAGGRRPRAGGGAGGRRPGAARPAAGGVAGAGAAAAGGVVGAGRRPG